MPWADRCPTSRRWVVAWRKRILDRADHDRDFRASVRERCRDDLVYFVCLCVWIQDPRRSRTLPFVPWPYEVQTLREIERAVDEGHDLLIEKSRDMGATWMVLAVFLHIWIFRPMAATLAISRTEDQVDKHGDPDTLFWKFRFALARLPTWMRPLTADTVLHVENLSNGAVLDGRATSADAARGGRRLAVLIDEHASIEHAAEVEAATADVSVCRLRVSTPKGMNTFGKLRHSGKVRVLSLHWSKHPAKARGLYTTGPGDVVKLLDGFRGLVRSERRNPDTNQPETVVYQFPDAYPFILDGKLRSPWYDGECVRRASDVEIAQELDLDYLRSGHAWFDGNVIERLKRTTVRPPVAAGDLAWEMSPEERVIVRAFVERPGGIIRLWCPLTVQDRPSQEANYAVACDVSEGQGASNSTGSVYNCTLGAKVGELVTASQLPEQFARTVVALCRWIGGGTGEPFLAWEQNGPGLIFGKEIVRLGYSYFYRVRREEEIDPRAGQSRVPGWPSSRVNKQLLLGDYRRDLAAGDFLNPSLLAVEECLQYVVGDDGQPIHEALVDEKTGARAAHGDRVIADALVNLARKELPHFAMPPRAIPFNSYLGRKMAEEERERRQHERD